MTCIGSSIPSFDAFAAAIERCAIEYGGPNWVSLAMTGAVTVLLLAFLIVTVILTLGRLRS